MLKEGKKAFWINAEVQLYIPVYMGSTRLIKIAASVESLRRIFLFLPDAKKSLRFQMQPLNKQGKKNTHTIRE